MTLKLQKPTPMDLVGGSQEPSPAVYVPSNPKAPVRPDSVPSQYSLSLSSKSTVYSSFPAFCCGPISDSISDSLTSVCTSVTVFTQHSKDFLGFVVRMSPLRHHPLIFNPQKSDGLILCMLKSYPGHPLSPISKQFSCLVSPTRYHHFWKPIGKRMGPPPQEDHVLYLPSRYDSLTGGCVLLT